MVDRFGLNRIANLLPKRKKTSVKAMQNENELLTNALV